jgi:hypothetical protein
MHNFRTSQGYRFAYFLLFIVIAIHPDFTFSQNIGIGIDPPIMKFHILNPGSDILLIENSTTLGAGITSAMYFKTGNGGFPYTGAIKTIGSSSNEARLGLFSYASSTSPGLIERMSITNDGKVGINKTTPLNWLDINGNIAIGTTYSGTYNAPANGMLIEGNVGIGTGSNALMEKLKVAGNATISGNGTQTLFRVTGPTGEIQFNPYFSTALGTSLVGSFRGASGRPQIRFESDVDNNILDIGMDNTGAFVLEHNDDPAIKIKNDGNAVMYGNLGIGTGNTVISEKLNVAGDATISGDGNITLFKVMGPAGEIRLTPYLGSSGATLLGYFDGIDRNPQVRFNINSSFIDAGMDADGAFVIEQSDLPVFKVDKNGNAVIGTLAPQAFGYTLSVGGKIASEEILVDLKADWPDYVFKSDYKLRTLTELEDYIQQKGHLPGLPAASEVQDVGIELGEMNRLLVEKIEELTLYILQQEERIKALEEKSKK